jgi:GAF domain-containing protein
LSGGPLDAGLDPAATLAALARRNADLEALAALASCVLEEPEAGAPRMLQAACAIVARTFGTTEAGVLLLDEAAGTLRPVAWHGRDAPLPAPAVLGGWPLAAEALHTGVPAASEGGPGGEGDRLPGSQKALLLVPVASRGRRRGLLVIRHARARRFSAADRSLALAMGDQLALALQHAEHHDEARRRAEELALLQDVGRTLVASLEPQAVLDAGVANLARIVDAPAAYLALLDADGRRLRIAAVAGPHPEARGLEVPNDPARGLAAAAMAQREPIHLDAAAPLTPRCAGAAGEFRFCNALSSLHCALREKPWFRWRQEYTPGGKCPEIASRSGGGPAPAGWHPDCFLKGVKRWAVCRGRSPPATSAALGASLLLPWTCERRRRVIADGAVCTSGPGRARGSPPRPPGPA